MSSERLSLAALCLAVLAGACSTGSSSPEPLSHSPAPCRTAQLELSFVSAQGAAGTLLDTFRLANRSHAACSLGGYVDLQLLDGQGRPLPSLVRHDGGPLASPPTPSSFVLGPGRAASFELAWSDVPHGLESVCPPAARMRVIPPGESEPLELATTGRLALAPCNGGQLFVYPLRPALSGSG